jgi:ribosomal protein S28E/S33
VQTERLANDVAMRVISRSVFVPVYEKVWQRTGVRGNLIDVIGPPPQQQ